MCQHKQSVGMGVPCQLKIISLLRLLSLGLKYTSNLTVLSTAGLLALLSCS